MIHSRVTAYGEKWEKWVDKNIGTSLKSVIPVEYRRRVLVDQAAAGQYAVHEELARRALEGKPEVQRMKEKVQPTRRPTPRRRPATATMSTDQATNATQPPTQAGGEEAAENEWRDMSGDARTTQQSVAIGL